MFDHYQLKYWFVTRGF